MRKQLDLCNSNPIDILQGNTQQQIKWAGRAWKNEIIGTYAQTDLKTSFRQSESVDISTAALTMNCCQEIISFFFTIVAPLPNSYFSSDQQFSKLVILILCQIFKFRNLVVMQVCRNEIVNRKLFRAHTFSKK